MSKMGRLAYKMMGVEGPEIEAKRDAVEQKFIHLVNKANHHLALELFRTNWWLAESGSEAERAITTADKVYHNQWPDSQYVSDSLRREYRVFAKLSNERGFSVTKEYPDHIKIIWSVSNLAGGTQKTERSAVVICVKGKSAKAAATQMQQRFEYFIRQDRPARLGTWLKELGVTFEFAKVHDCEQHPLK